MEPFFLINSFIEEYFLKEKHFFAKIIISQSFGAFLQKKFSTFVKTAFYVPTF